MSEDVEDRYVEILDDKRYILEKVGEEYREIYSLDTSYKYIGSQKDNLYFIHNLQNEQKIYKVSLSSEKQELEELLDIGTKIDKNNSDYAIGSLGIFDDKIYLRVPIKNDNSIGFEKVLYTLDLNSKVLDEKASVGISQGSINENGTIYYYIKDNDLYMYTFANNKSKRLFPTSIILNI